MQRVPFFFVSLFLTFGCKEVTSDVVSKAVQASKETASGIAQGIEEGRKSGSSADGALIVSQRSELEGHGSVVVRAGEDGALELVVENRSDRPLRLTKLEALALDAEGFAVKPIRAPDELTIPARAKERSTLTFAAQGKRLAKLRLWGEDFDVAQPSGTP